MMLRRRNAALALALLGLGGQVNAFTSLVSGSKGKTALNVRADGFIMSTIDLAREDLTPVIKTIIANLLAENSPVSLDPQLLPLAGVALAVLAGGAFAASKKGSSSKPAATTITPVEVEEKVDLSIPYDAAALIAFREVKGLKESENYDEKEFKSFKIAYEEAAVANVIVKKMERDLLAKQAEAEQMSKKLSSLF